MLPESVQLITSIGALLLGMAYVVGGLVVNLHLGTYGITEYQILRVKYLVVGLIYFISIIIFICVAAVMNAMLLIFSLNNSGLSQAGYFVLSLASAFVLLYGGFTNRPGLTRIFGRSPWFTFEILGFISFGYPIAVGMRRALGGAADIPLDISGVGAILCIVVAVLGQIYYYAHYIYGNPTNLDPIGMGIPVRVRLAGLDKDIALLTHMGLPSTQPDLTDQLLLLDETDSHYIVRLDGSSPQNIFKINKELVKGIIYLN